MAHKDDRTSLLEFVQPYQHACPGVPRLLRAEPRRQGVIGGVRMIELTCPSVGHDRWDQHSNLLKGHEENALAVDQPIMRFA